MAFDIAVFPLPGGPSKTKIAFEINKAIIASAISTEDFVHLISFKEIIFGFSFSGYFKITPL